jgi:hypothetical protein
MINKRSFPFDVNSDSLNAEIDVINRWAEEQLDLVDVTDFCLGF